MSMAGSQPKESWTSEPTAVAGHVHTTGDLSAPPGRQHPAE
ncbi:hypothetical protein [Streptomyces mayonensis]|nr:hypothetical protein [Streptomyces sp. A108]